MDAVLFSRLWITYLSWLNYLNFYDWGGHCLVPLKHSNSHVCHRDRSGQTHNVSRTTLLTNFFFHWDSHRFRPFLCKQTLLNGRESSHDYSQQKQNPISPFCGTHFPLRNCLLYMCIKTQYQVTCLNFHSIPLRNFFFRNLGIIQFNPKKCIHVQ